MDVLIIFFAALFGAISTLAVRVTLANHRAARAAREAEKARPSSQAVPNVHQSEEGRGSSASIHQDLENENVLTAPKTVNIVEQANRIIAEMARMDTSGAVYASAPLPPPYVIGGVEVQAIRGTYNADIALEAMRSAVESLQKLEPEERAKRLLEELERVAKLSEAMSESTRTMYELRAVPAVTTGELIRRLVKEGLVEEIKKSPAQKPEPSGS